MIIIELNSQDCAVRVKEITSKSTGEIMQFREQRAYIYNGGIYPKQCVIGLDKEQAEYPAGRYTLSDDSYDVGDFGTLKFARNIKLVPLKDK
ncbi:MULTISPECIES: single-stranded DNA-binding protein [Providencia]|uniref:single-stranded DNA-binding protein n=1 Tax=Providencia TaxID=586 RepID=UPI00065DCF8F|nr:single-stranded DNA-binding protein [Providencia rettgeri]